MPDLRIVSFGGLALNDGVNYTAGIQPAAEWGLPLADLRALRYHLLRVRSPYVDTPIQLIIATPDGSQQRSVLSLVERLLPRSVGEMGAANLFAVQARVHGDVRWRAVNASTDTWNITASGQTRTITNAGTDDAFPVFRIRPTSAKTGGYGYRRWCPVVWRSANAAQQYPVIFTLDTAALISAGKMRSDGNDLRVLVDGTETPRWLHGLNTTSTKIAVNLNFSAAPTLTLRVAIPSSGSIASIEVNEDISRAAEAGTLLIDSEAFTYTGRVIAEKRFTGITRAAKGTAMAAHAVGTPVYWIQRDVWIVYGNPAALAPVQDDRLRPCFDLAQSTNTSWVYADFGDADEMRAARWFRWGAVTLSGRGGVYTATERTLASPYAVAGAWLSELQGNAYGWGLINPCGIVNVAWANGKRRRAGTGFVVHCRHWRRGASWWSDHYSLPPPSSVNVWETWSYSGPPFPVSDVIAIAAYFHPQDAEAGDATVTLNSSETPLVTVNAEQGGYTLLATLTNTTTNERFTVVFTMALNTEIEIDCDNRTIRYLADNSRQLQALTVGPGQRHWMRLAPGNNTLRFDDAGTNGVTVTTTWRPRWY
jgi:hypothetical protein